MFKNILYLAIFTLVVVITWIGFEVYNSNVTSTITGDQSVIITPIPPDFNAAAIIALKSKKVIPADLSQNASSAAVSTIVTPTPTPQTITTPATQSAQPTQAIAPTINL